MDGSSQAGVDRAPAALRPAAPWALPVGTDAKLPDRLVAPWLASRIEAVAT